MDIHESFKSLNMERIDLYIKEKKEEDINLEFKTISRSDLSERNDKKNFAKALSGFANSDGGLLVWGIKAKKNEKGIDHAYGKKEIDNLALFLSKLHEFTGQFVKPIVEGVKHKKIVSTGNKGFAVSLIPHSVSGPHMAKAGEDRYYKRSGANSYRMEHFDIEDMFGRRKKPKLSLKTDITQTLHESGPNGEFFECGVIVSIKNCGIGIAKYISLALAVNSPYKIGRGPLDKEGRFGLIRLGESPPWQVRFMGNTNIIIHSNSHLEITVIKRKFNATCTKTEDLIIDYELKAENMLLVKDSMTISGNEILKKILPHKK